ncbi:MAG: hypothetical protein V1723_02190 [Candidatus Uhrbacteria bacterium]
MCRDRECWCGCGRELEDVGWRECGYSADGASWALYIARATDCERVVLADGVVAYVPKSTVRVPDAVVIAERTYPVTSPQLLQGLPLLVSEVRRGWTYFRREQRPVQTLAFPGCIQ